MKVFLVLVVSAVTLTSSAAGGSSAASPKLKDAQERLRSLEVGDSTAVRWELVSRTSDLPPDAIRVGFGRDHDKDVANFAGRVFFKNAIVPSRVSRPELAANSTQYQSVVVWEGATEHFDSFEVACADSRRVRWVPATNGRVPRGAVVSGVTAGGGPLYVCRVYDNTILIEVENAQYRFMMEPGVLDPYSGVCNTELWGIRAFPTYEVLVSI